MQREQIDNLIVDLMVIENFSKDIHYTCHGEAFFGKHLLVDKFSFGDSIDLIKECVLLGESLRPLTSKEYLSRAAEAQLQPRDNDDRYNFNVLLGMLNSALMTIQEIVDVKKGIENVLGGIAQDLQQYKGLINLQIEE